LSRRSDRNVTLTERPCRAAVRNTLVPVPGLPTLRRPRVTVLLTHEAPPRPVHLHVLASTPGTRPTTAHAGRSAGRDGACTGRSSGLPKVGCCAADASAVRPTTMQGTQHRRPALLSAPPAKVSSALLVRGAFRVDAYHLTKRLTHRETLVPVLGTGSEHPRPALEQDGGKLARSGSELNAGSSSDRPTTLLLHITAARSGEPGLRR